MITSTPLPVTLLTGFLGSGKTTLLNHLLRHVPLTAVVMNEFGEVGLDHQLLEETKGPLALLSGGCICCQVQGALGPTLKNLWMGREEGKLPPFERVIIETTGIADPAPILDTLLNDRFVAARYAMDGVVTTVDAVLGVQQLESYSEARRQAAVADRIVLTKTDLADPAERQGLESALDELNPAAPRLVAVQGALDPAQVLHVGAYATDGKHPDVLKWLAQARYKPARLSLSGLKTIAPASPAKPDSAHARIHSFSVLFDEPLDWAGLGAALDMLTVFRASSLLRMKGIIHIAGREKPMVLHGVQHVIYPPAELPDWPDQDRRSRFVFITDGLEPEFVHKLLADFTQAAQSGAMDSSSAAAQLLREAKGRMG